MNKVILSGNLTKDPDVRYAQSGSSYAKAGIAVNRPFSKNSDTTTDFFNLTLFGKQAEFCGRYLKKGSSVIVEGRIQNNNYEDKNGVKHYSVDILVENIEFAGRKNSDSKNNATNEDNNSADDNDNSDNSKYDDNTDDVDVPF